MNTDTTGNTCVRRYHPAAPNAPRLVCFPHAGGSAPFYLPVSKALVPAVDVVAVQYPGRQDRHTEPLVDSIHALADQLCEELRPFTDRPLTFFGHSMGAAVAFEVALRMSRAGLPSPVRIFASARRAPSLRSTDNIHLRDDQGIMDQLHLLSGTDNRVLGNEEIMRMSMPAIRNDYKAIETYRPAPGSRVDCPVTVFVGDDDPTTSPEEAAAWHAHTTADCETEVFPGGHFYLADRPGEVIAALSRRMTDDAVHVR